LKALYDKIGGKINPLLLIQLPNDKVAVDTEDNRIKDIVTADLAQPSVDITEENGKLAIWLSNAKTPNLKNIPKKDDITEVMLFKEAPSKGWDCPRASVLLIFREMKSQSFTIQTVGRIMRMPDQKYYMSDALNHGYVYTNIQNDYIEIKEDEADYISKTVSNIRPNIEPVTLRASVSEIKRVRNRLGYDFRKVLEQTIVDEWGLAQTNLFDDFLMTGDSSIDQTVLNNRKNVAAKGIDLDVSKIYTKIPKDVTMDMSQTGRYDLDRTQQARVARTQDEVDRLFRFFCYENVGQFAKVDSAPSLSAALLRFMHDQLKFTEIEAKKIILYYNNRHHFVSVIKKALNRYVQMKQEALLKAKVEVNTFDWSLPVCRWYNGETHKAIKAPMHALQPFYELNNASSPEKAFREILERHNDSIEWWYKNGDSGREHFSIVYKASDGRDANFYPDFIIRLRNGKICIFDTKSPNGDTESVGKHNALQAYVTENNMVGGIIVKEGGRWIYSAQKIDSAADHAGWIEFDPEQLNN